MTTMTGKTQMLTVRVPHDLVARIDARVAQLRSQNPGIDFNRADVLKQLLVKEFGAPSAPTATSRRR